jgi:hypothetical protein
MPLCLKDGFYYVRSEIGELEQFNWSDDQIIFDLNNVAQEMCSIAGELTKYQNLELVVNGDEGTQEAALDVEIDQVKACKYFSGQLFDLEPHDWQSLQIGAATGSIPRWYYLKTGTRELTPQSTATSDIVEIPLGPNMPGGETFRTVLGVWPIPPEPAEIHIWYSYFHPWMQSPTDVCLIARKYLPTWAYGVIARCMRIEKAYEEAEYYNAKYEKGKEEYRIWASKQRQGQKPARYGVIVEPWRQNASSSVILVDPYPLGP